MQASSNHWQSFVRATRERHRWFKKGAVLDKVQRAPEHFSYLQEISDNTRMDDCLSWQGAITFCCSHSYRNHWQEE